MRMESTRCMYIVELMLLSVRAVHSCTSRLDLTRVKTNSEISYPALCGIEVLKRGTERNDIAGRVVFYIDECSSRPIAPKDDAGSCPCQGRVVGTLRPSKGNGSRAQVYRRTADRGRVIYRSLDWHGIVTPSAEGMSSGAEISHVDPRPAR